MPRAWWCFARAAIRTGESSDDLKSWLFGTASCSSTGWVHLCDRLLRSRRGTPPHSLRPRISRSPCIIPAGLHGPRPDGSMPASSRRTVQPFDFPEISLFPLRASASRAAFQGIALQRLMRSAPGTASSISLKQLLCKPFSLCDLAHLSTPPRRRPHQKAFGPPPLPGRWPSDPYRPVTGLRNAPFGAVLAGRASVFEVSNHRWTSTALLRERRKARTTWIEQSAFQTFLPAKSLQIRGLADATYPKPEKLSSPAPFFGRTETIKSEYWNSNQILARMKRPPVPLVSHSGSRVFQPAVRIFCRLTEVAFALI